ncbi:MAG: triose-phosphate isomerase, partial [Caldilineales bacterium]|nr:triose-phosphate isomerase [Caldilineales bacterium]
KEDMVTADGMPLGALSVYNTADAATRLEASDWDRKVLTFLAHYAALAVRSAAHQEALRLAHEQRAAAETFAAVGDIAANLLHRLNNKIGIIPVRVEGIQDKCQASLAADPYLATNLAEIGRSAAEAMEALSDSLFYLRPIRPAPVDIAGAVAQALAGTTVGVGAQDVFWEEKGAYTGEIAPGMLVGLASYCIIGHSERRALFGETDEWVNRKAKALLAHGITPIICVGESLEQNRRGETDAFVGQQVRAALAGLTAEQVARLVIAYEPIWAIGTGLTATPVDANRIIGLSVRGVVAELFGEATAQAIRIQYGGSTNAQNIYEFMLQPEIDGALVGGASLTVASCVAMVRETARARGL